MTVEALAARVAAEARARPADRPYVLLKTATSLDGRVATRRGDSQWITSEEARAAGRRLRAALPAIAVGVDTVIADDPRLTARAPGLADPRPVIFDSRLRTPRAAAILAARPLVLTTRAAPAARRRALEDRGAEVVAVRSGRGGRVGLPAALAALAERGLYGVLVEGGPTVHGAFWDAGLVDRVAWFQAPLILGGPRGAHGGRGVARLAEAIRLEAVERLAIGPDLLVTGVPQMGAPRAAARPRAVAPRR